jgi:hypothetical protein
MRGLAPILLTGVLTACMPDEEPVCSHDPPLTYDNFGEGFTTQFCTGCHSSIVPEEHRMGAPEAYNFDTYEGVLYWADKIEPVVMDGEMPPGGGPTDAEKVQFAEWMACSVMPDAEIYWYGD